MTIFDRDSDGGREIAEVVGMMSDRADFNVWRPIIPLGMRDVSAIIGPEPVRALAAIYESRADQEPDGERYADALRYLQQAVAMFTWLKIIPTLDAQHDTTGRTRRIGDNEKGLTALEQYKDEANIQRLAYEATDALVETLEAGAFDFWTTSKSYTMRASLLLRSKAEFDNYYNLGSHRLFVTLLPMMREAQAANVAPVLGPEWLRAVLARDGSAPERMADHASRALALETMRLAILRLPVEVLPEGIVQINLSAPVSQRLRAERDARESVAANLGAAVEDSLRLLADEVRAATPEITEAPYVRRPLDHRKGFSF